MTSGRVTSWFAEHALLPSGLARAVRFDVADGRFTSVIPDSAALGCDRLPGIVLPGFANCHSHAFHRALRGRTHDAGGTFWTWRRQMYALAARLDPDTYLALARATYAEMALAGITSVGEFHYLHHAPGGVQYADPNAMAEALRLAAVEAGVRLTLLDTCYLTGGLDGSGHLRLDDVQRRFADSGVDAWASRFGALTASSGMRTGAAIHSVRAVQRSALRTVGQAAGDGPLHVHLSEQPAENEACAAFYQCTPTELLDSEQVLGERTTAVHATHLRDSDVQTLARTGTGVCMCPSTERDLADGIGPARALSDAQVPLSLGSDQQAVIDLFDDARSLEMHERLASRQRGRFRPAELLQIMTRHESIGWSDAGRLAPGARADAVAIRTDTVRAAGCEPAQILFAATAADIDTVLVDGRCVVQNGRHALGDVAKLLQQAITAVTHS